MGHSCHPNDASPLEGMDWTRPWSQGDPGEKLKAGLCHLGAAMGTEPTKDLVAEELSQVLHLTLIGVRRTGQKNSRKATGMDGSIRAWRCFRLANFGESRAWRCFGNLRFRIMACMGSAGPPVAEIFAILGKFEPGDVCAIPALQIWGEIRAWRCFRNL